MIFVGLLKAHAFVMSCGLRVLPSVLQRAFGRDFFLGVFFVVFFFKLADRYHLYMKSAKNSISLLSQNEALCNSVEQGNM